MRSLQSYENGELKALKQFVGNVRSGCGVAFVVHKPGGGTARDPIEATVSHSGVSPHHLFTVILNDVTERRQSEQQREKLMR